MGAPKQSPIENGARVRPGVRASLALIGFTAAVAQIVLMREFMVVFIGNEISLGLTLANWLLWTAIGSGLLGRIGRQPEASDATDAGRPPADSAGRAFAALLTLEAVAFPVTIFVVRISRVFFHPAPGELLGPGAMLLTSFVALSLFCLISGWLFAAGARLYAIETGKAARATGSVYLMEALGSAIGGILASVVLIRYLDAFQIASVIVLLNLLGATFVSRRAGIQRTAVIGVFAITVGAFVFAAPRLQQASYRRLWRGFDLVASRDSVYGNLAVIAGESSRSLYVNGLNVFNAPDPAAAEEAVHYALLEHPWPRTVLLLGGGVNGSAAEVLRHPSVTRVDYVELDPAIFELAKSYFPQQWAAMQSEPRIHIHTADGRLFVKTTGEKFDVIIVNLPDPETAQLNRFYTREFFREAAERLNSGGLVALQLRSSENYISPELAAFLACIQRTLRDVFPRVTAIPGETVHFFASADSGVLANNSNELVSRLRARNLQTSYVREYYIPFRMTPDRMLDLDMQIRPQAHTPVNRDFSPIAYYFDVALWSGQFNRGYRQVLAGLASARFGAILIGTLLILCGIAAVLMLANRKGKGARASAGFCVATMGFTLIGLEILLLLGFQAIYGYVYHQLAIVIGAFMAGMALGSWRALSRSENSIRTVAVLQLMAAVAPLLLFGILVSLTWARSAVGSFLISQLVFPALALCSGMLGGYQFPIATQVFVADRKDGSPGALYALDLAGACCAAVVLSAYLVPVFGFLNTAVTLGMANLAPAGVALWASRVRTLRA